MLLLAAVGPPLLSASCYTDIAVLLWHSPALQYSLGTIGAARVVMEYWHPLTGTTPQYGEIEAYKVRFIANGMEFALFNPTTNGALGYTKYLDCILYGDVAYNV